MNINHMSIEVTLVEETQLQECHWRIRVAVHANGKIRVVTNVQKTEPTLYQLLEIQHNEAIKTLEA